MIPYESDSGITKEAAAALVKMYEDAAEGMIRTLSESIDTEDRGQAFRQARAAQLLKQLDQQLQQFGKSVAPKVEGAVMTAYTTGLQQGTKQLKEAGIPTKGPVAGSFALIASDASRVLAHDIVVASKRAMTGLRDDAGRVIKQMAASQAKLDPEVSKIIAKGLISGDPRQAIRETRELFRTDPAESYRKLSNRIITVGNANLSVRHYADILVRTRTREAAVAGRHDRLRRADVQLVMITGKVSTNFCTRYLGLVCKIDPRAEGPWPTLSSMVNGGPPFHPQCSKGTRPFVERLVSDEDRDIAKDALKVFSEVGDVADPLSKSEMNAARRRAA